MRKLLLPIALISLIMTAAPVFAAEDPVLREIARCDDIKELGEKAKDIAKDFNLSGSDTEAVKLSAARFQAYMSYIIVRQNEMISGQLAELKKEAAPQ